MKIREPKSNYKKPTIIFYQNRRIHIKLEETHVLKYQNRRTEKLKQTARNRHCLRILECSSEANNRQWLMERNNLQEEEEEEDS